MAIPRDVQSFINSITDPATRTAAEQTFNSILTSTNSIQRAFDGIKVAFGSATSTARQFRDELDGSLDLAKAIVDALNKQEGPIVRAKKAMNGLVSVGQQLVEEERELEALDERRLKRLANESAKKLRNFQIEAQNIGGRIGIDAKMIQNAQRLARINALTSQTQINATKKLKEKLQAELEVLSAYKQQEISYKAIQEAAEKRYKLEQATTKTFGLTGAELSAASSIASKFGMSHVQDQLEDINNKLREEMRKEIEANDGKALSFGKRFQYAAKGAAQVGKALLTGMLDPLYIMGKIFDAFLEVNKAAVDYQRLSGINATNQAALNSRLATSVDYLQTAAELTRQLGMSATSVFSNDDIAALAEAKNLLGLSAEQAGSLGIKSKLANTSIDKFQDNLLKGVSAGNKLNNSLVAPGVALQDVLDTSVDITMSLGSNPEALGKAAVAARAFGLNLQQVNDIASSLLNFEDSIGNELEAELMTGKYLNLEKAREYALTNNLEGLSQELAKNGATAAEFSKMNRLEQESLAKALGMNREQLGKSILAQEASKNATLAQRAAVMGVTKEQMQSMDIQERMAKSMDKLAQAFAPILEGLIPVAEALFTALQPVAEVIGVIASAVAAILSPITMIQELFAGWGKSISSVLGPLGFVGKTLKVLATLAVGYAAYSAYASLAAIPVIGAGLGAVAAATILGAGMGFLGSIKDGVIDPKKGPVMTGEFGSVQLDPSDKAMYGADGKVKVGTNLIGNKPDSLNKSTTISQAASKSDNTSNEIRQMREENKQLLTALLNKTGDVYMDTNKVGRAQVIGNYKSS